MRFTLAFVGLVVGLAIAASLSRAHDAPAADMLAAAKNFLGALTPEQARSATYPLTDSERENWNFVPLARQGLPLKKMDPSQRDFAMKLLRTGLGQRGITQAEGAMSMELVLKGLENGAAHRDPLLYYVTIFGRPAVDKTWGWRFEGHHLSFNFTLVDGSHIFFAPSFIGSNPAEVREGPRQGERLLGPEDDLARALVKSLTESQKKIAVIADTAPREIMTSNHARAKRLEPQGIAAVQLTPAQRASLTQLVKLYFDRWRPEIAGDAFSKFRADAAGEITFAWAGSLERGEANYYRIQTPSFLIEFDNTQNNANHIHTVFRDFNGDFGHDLLAEHYAREHGGGG